MSDSIFNQACDNRWKYVENHTTKFCQASVLMTDILCLETSFKHKHID